MLPFHRNLPADVAPRQHFGAVSELSGAALAFALIRSDSMEQKQKG